MGMHNSVKCQPIQLQRENQNENIKETAAIVCRKVLQGACHVLTMDIMGRNLIMITTYIYAGRFRFKCNKDLLRPRRRASSRALSQIRFPHNIDLPSRVDKQPHIHIHPKLLRHMSCTSEQDGKTSSPVTIYSRRRGAWCLLRSFFQLKSREDLMPMATYSHCKGYQRTYSVYMVKTKDTSLQWKTLWDPKR